MGTELWAIGLMLVVSVVSALASFCLKLVSSELSFNIKRIITSYKLIIGLFLYAFGTILALVAYSGGELSVLYPFVAFQYVWANLLSMKYLGERSNHKKWVAVALIIVGIVFVGLGS